MLLCELFGVVQVNVFVEQKRAERLNALVGSVCHRLNAGYKSAVDLCCKVRPRIRWIKGLAGFFSNIEYKVLPHGLVSCF